MDYLILYHNEPIAKMVASDADISMGVVNGPFVPFPPYEHVHPVFRIYAELVNSGQAHGEQLRQYYEKRDGMTRHLSITTITGLPVETIWIDIDDFSEYLGDDGYIAHFCVAAREFFEDLSLWDPPDER